jgi:membrane protease YdiL (CAAX protease family)
MSGTFPEITPMDEAAKNTLLNDPDSTSHSTNHSKAPFVTPDPLPSFPGFMQRVFIGPKGMRWVWRLLAYLGMREILYLLLGSLLYYADQAGVSYLWTNLMGESVLLLAAVAPALALAPLEGRRFGDFGLPWRKRFGKLFWMGAAWGFGAVTLLVLAMHGAGVLDIGKLSLHGARIFRFAAFWGLYFLIVGFAEEFYLRGYTQFTLTEGIGFWPAALALSIAFAMLHRENPGETMAGLMGAGVIGLFFCLTLRRTGTLWFAIGFHAAWDWGESYFYSVPDSGTVAPGHLLKISLHGPAWLTGGSAGPEGSTLLFILVALLWVAFDRNYRDVKYGKIEG